MGEKSGNNNLRKANKAKNDEFYTQISDIEKEIKHYKKHLKGKIIFCNCDDPEESNFFKYFALNFEVLGLQKLISTHYEYEKQSYKLEITKGLDINNDGKIDLKDTVKTPLKENGDFRSDECIEILKESDIVITNPPFSLFREYVSQLIEYKKKFLLIGNMNAITYKEIFKLIKENKIWAGHGFNLSMVFRSPYENNLEANKKFCEQKGYFGKNYIKTPAINWFTNLDFDKRHEDLILYKKFNKEEYQNYYNFDGININKVKDIPLDYKGKMGVPITFLGKYNPEQFEILGIAADKREINNAFIQGKQTYLDEKHKKFVGMVIEENGILKATYARIIIKNKRI